MMGLRYLLGIKGVASLSAIALSIGFGLGGGAVYFTPYFGMRDTVARLKPFEGAFEAQGDAFDQSEGNRAQEAAQAVSAVAQEREACEGKTAALRTALDRALAQLNEEHTYDQAGCPIRSVIPVGELLGDTEDPGSAPAGTGEDGSEDLRDPAE